MPALTSTPLALIVTAALAYLVGSIPFGLLLARAMGLGNLREIGSGNIGATNVLRTGSKKAAALTLLLDAVKGAVPVLIARNLLGEDAAQVAGLAAFLGHLFPVWIGFRGGKGVATFLGVVLALAWPVGVAACMTWLVVAYATRYSSLSALVAAALSPVWAWMLGYQQTVGLILLLVVLIFLRHHENISRLIAGTESRIGAKK
ncbi:glycerol-3-phosphate acyltransferase [Haematobacter massiliensis]|uniref:Glycerol-3-phosphate acyltransferase n=1 Tax=Haematobacter massiliensis TaxID=195105 RepID=A0A086YAR9_9RHOB|nr:glycerol-3-phosphate 1-O-acyltransferase PlsY [Haematobacter massiliensis]KFI31369.1 glycerol-3-phosphate acyltransferase [Haematobacter massiliensis]OWJ73704.1 glycerol-3-phosphate acyltransferase [Haematobacter massiliensis]OWJ84156.1 glycerol-3-phosphate acyltransferase [Haematobacter massiliensis]QBJ25257.1 glycerol-3-phosphate 1-O-acyltransferase PlsY [Haematobacter massiliensis]